MTGRVGVEGVAQAFQDLARRTSTPRSWSSPGGADGPVGRQTRRRREPAEDLDDGATGGERGTVLEVGADDLDADGQAAGRRPTGTTVAGR